MYLLYSSVQLYSVVALLNSLSLSRCLSIEVTFGSDAVVHFTKEMSTFVSHFVRLKYEVTGKIKRHLQNKSKQQHRPKETTDDAFNVSTSKKAKETRENTDREKAHMQTGRSQNKTKTKNEDAVW